MIQINGVQVVPSSCPECGNSEMVANRLTIIGMVPSGFVRFGCGYSIEMEGRETKITSCNFDREAMTRSREDLTARTQTNGDSELPQSRSRRLF